MQKQWIGGRSYGERKGEACRRPEESVKSEREGQGYSGESDGVEQTLSAIQFDKGGGP